MKGLFESAENCLLASSIEEKIHLTQLTAQLWQSHQVSLEAIHQPKTINQPGHPERLILVAPKEVPKRKPGTPEGLIALVHAIAHIEFNAINLAWDAVYRFRNLPEQFYQDWVQIAVEEAHHFQLLRQRLQELGIDYGDLPAHNGLWDMASSTAWDPMVRMALVPRVLEARGLDVTPGMIEKLIQLGDEKTAAILNIILRDEIGHVAIGSRWFKYFCAQRGLASEPTFQTLIERYFSGQMKGPFDHKIREQAGFSSNELKALENFVQSNIHSKNAIPS